MAFKAFDIKAELSFLLNEDRKRTVKESASVIKKYSDKRRKIKWTG